MSSNPGESVTPLESPIVENPSINWVTTPPYDWQKMYGLDSVSTPVVFPAFNTYPDEVTKPTEVEMSVEQYRPRTATGASLLYNRTYRRPLTNRSLYGRSVRSLVPGDITPLPAKLYPFTPEPAPTEPNPPEKNITGSHLASDLDPVALRKRIELTARALAGYDFDTIAFRGVSGTILAAPLALAMNKEMVLVRKDEDDSHSYYKVEGNQDVRRYIIVDDFVCSGETGRQIVSRIKAWAPEAECLGLIETRYVSEHRIDRAKFNDGKYELVAIKLKDKPKDNDNEQRPSTADIL